MASKQEHGNVLDHHQCESVSLELCCLTAYTRSVGRHGGTFPILALFALFVRAHVQCCVGISSRSGVNEWHGLRFPFETSASSLACINVFSGGVIKVPIGFHDTRYVEVLWGLRS